MLFSIASILLVIIKVFLPSISVLMGPTELPTQSADVVKIPTAHYEFGANFLDPQVCSWIYFFQVPWTQRGSNYGDNYLLLMLQMMLVGRVMTDGRVNARVKCDLSENLSLKANGQVNGCYLQLLLSLPYFYVEWLVYLIIMIFLTANWWATHVTWHG